MNHRGIKRYWWIIQFLIFASFLFAQETHNLEIIWQKASSPDGRYFGKSLSSGDLNGDNFSDIVIAGDSLYGGDTWTSKAYVFYGGSPFDTILDLVISRPESTGFHIAICVRDLNNDNFDDLVLGSQHRNEVSIFLGGNPMDTICDYRIRGPGGGSVFGCAVSSGDVNGDSFADLIVGAYGFANLRGRVYIYFGGPSFDTIPDVILNGGHQGDYEGFGTSVGGKGDVNNDGYQDMIIGAANFGSSYNGRIYIYFGGNPVDTIADVSMIGEGPNQQLGWARVDFLKNLNDFDNATASTSLWPRGVGYCPGKVYVLFGGNNMDSIPDICMIGRQDSSLLGTSTSSAGDVNGDSCDDIISGAPTEYDNKGTAYIWLGGSILDTIPDAWIRGEIGGDRIGWHLTSAGDINGDNKDEVMVSNSVGRNPRVWVCKYTGPGIGEERLTQNAERFTLGINPNPARSYLTVRLPHTANRQMIKIFDVSGKLIKEIASASPRNDGMVKISLKGINPGIYFLRVGKEPKKFIITR